MPDATVTIRPYADGDLSGTLELLEAALGETPLLKRTPELFAWKHLDNPFGRSILLVAEAEGRIAGLRAFMRWELETAAGQRLRCVRAVDTATHPEFQRRGIFSRLTRAALDAAERDGVDLVFNTPNPKSGAGYLKMGWQHVGAIGVLAAPSRGIVRGKPAQDQPPRPEDYLANPQPANNLEVSDRSAAGLRTPRTGAYLRWRFSQHPTARYVRIDRKGSTAIVRPNLRGGRRELVLSDVFGPHPGAAIGATIAQSRAAYVAGWFSEGSPERAAAMRRGLVPIPKLTTLTLVARPLRALPTDVGSLAAWDLASSDLELL
ncbi:MAG TPA: GNAT family N-acetyltransferase [Acidimicrobiia bacterium]|jgi:GNAT superfamily N-acetyltransferase|nr:GNAT family N-acetyltransferase [Acidimicrobiia bacterium]